MERHYFGKNFNLKNLADKLMRCHEKELKGYSYKISWFAITEKKSLLLVVMMESKGEGFKHLILDLLSLEKSFDISLLKNTNRLEFPLSKKPLLLEGEYLFCKLQAWSLEIGLIEQDKPCQTVEEAQAFIKAYAFCEDLYPSINQYAWGKKCLPQKGKLDGRDVFYLDVDNTIIVVEKKCHELYSDQKLEKL